MGTFLPKILEEGFLSIYILFLKCIFKSKILNRSRTTTIAIVVNMRTYSQQFYTGRHFKTNATILNRHWINATLIICGLWNIYKIFYTKLWTWFAVTELYKERKICQRSKWFKDKPRCLNGENQTVPEVRVSQVLWPAVYTDPCNRENDPNVGPLHLPLQFLKQWLQ